MMTRFHNALGGFHQAGLGAVALVMFLAGHSAHAQMQGQLLDQFIATDIPGIAVGPGVTVTSRQHPEYDSLGVRLGEVTVRPELNETVGYDDNVLARKPASGSMLVETNAQMQADYNGSVVQGSAALTVDDYRFPEQQEQSYTNWTAQIGGSYEIGYDTLTAGFQHLNLAQTVRDLDVPQLDRALPFRIDSGRVEYKAMFSRVFVQPSLTLSSYSYDNGTVLGLPFIQSNRDRVVVQPSVTVGYELAPRRNLIVVVRDANATYSNQIAGQPTRNYNDAAILAGIDYDAGGIWRYRLLVGYETRTYQSNQFKTIQAPIIEATAIWNPTGLTTVTATANRHIEDSTDETTVGLTETAVKLRVDHELFRNVQLWTTAALFFDDYAQNQGHQSLYTLGTGATWLLNRNMQLTASYDFSSRESNGSATLGFIPGQVFGSNFSENRYLLQLHLAL
jgi:hypothetical protein